MFGLQAVGYRNAEGYLKTHLLTSRFGFKMFISNFSLCKLLE